MRGKRLLSLTGVVAGVILGMGVLAFGGSAQAQENEIEAAVGAVVTAWNAQDAEAFIELFTPEGLEQVVGIEPTVAAVEADMESTGPIASHEVSNIKLEGGVFTAIVDIRFVAGFSVYERWSFVQSDGDWLISGNEPASRPIPPGVPVVDMTLQEYAFVYNKDAINAADGNFAFSVTNSGQEEHEVVVLEITSDDSLLELLQNADPESEDIPEGLEFVAFGGFFEPGQTGTTVFDGPLSPGRYGLVCFVPAPNGTPHAFLGMVSEFTVGSGPVPAPTTPAGGGGITPPNTGDGGLLGGNGSSASWLLLGLALTLVLGGTAGLVKSRVATSA